MKTRAQTLLQARKRDRQARKTVLKIPIAIAIPIPVSESGSSSVGPGEPREKRKGLPANMPPKGKKHATLLKQEIQPRSVGTSCFSTDLNSSVKTASLASVAGTMHGWKPDEQILLGLMKAPNMVQHYHCSKTKFYRQAALLMDVVSHRQIGRKVEKMVKSLKKHFDADEPGDVGITREEFNSLISGPATTGSCSKSSSKSASKTGGKKYTVPKDYDTSLVYLREKGATNNEYYDYIRVLKDDDVLTGFISLKYYHERKQFIDDMVKRLLRPPEAAPPGPCATNYADDI